VSDARGSQPRCVLSGGSRRKLVVPRPSPDRACLSWSCAALQSDCPKLASIRIGWMLPSCPWPLPAGLQGVRSLRLPCLLVKVDPEILSWAWALLQSAPSSERPRGPSRLRRDPAAPCGSSHEVCSPSASFHTRQRSRRPGLPHPTTCALRFSQPLDALVRPVLTGLVSCRIRSWGCALQSFAPLAQPYAVSSADPLLTLHEPANLLSFERRTPPKRRAPNEIPLRADRRNGRSVTEPQNSQRGHRNEPVGNTEVDPNDRKASPIQHGPPKQTALEMDPPTGSAGRSRRRTVLRHDRAADPRADDPAARNRAAGRNRRTSCDEKAPGASSSSGVCSTRESATSTPAV
jgi:hypothetical protein